MRITPSEGLFERLAGPGMIPPYGLDQGPFDSYGWCEGCSFPEWLNSRGLCEGCEELEETEEDE